jgi:hypothetical protein
LFAAHAAESVAAATSINRVLQVVFAVAMILSSWLGLRC